MPGKTIRVAKSNIGADDIGQYLKSFAYAVGSGKFDTHLDVLYRIVDDRIRVYTGVSKPVDTDTEKKLGRVKKLRDADLEPVIGSRYGVFGERYRGVVVEYKGEATPYEDGSRKARVLVLESGQSALASNTAKMLPIVALQELPKSYAGPKDNQ